MVRVFLMLDSGDVGKQYSWQVYQMDDRNLRSHNCVDRCGKLGGSYWWVHLGKNKVGLGLEERYQLPISPIDAVKSGYFVAKLRKFFEVAELIRNKGELMGVRMVVVTSSYRQPDPMRVVVKELISAVVRNQWLNLSPELIVSGRFGKLDVFKTVLGDVVVTYGRDYLVLGHIEGDLWYWVGNKRLVDKVLVEVV